MDYKIMNYKKTLRYLYGLETPKFLPGLKNIKSLLARLGNPEKNLKCIHVAGTNGKGSVCAMLQSVLMESGYRVGMYTSPHLKKFNERIRINNKCVSDKEIAGYFLKIKPFITRQSFFEITTAMAFLYFYEKKVDFVVLEVGLGGRLDATNVIIPMVSVITNIGLEHTEFLGSTMEKIAYEKAGIIKKNVPVVAGAKGNALKAIRNIAKQENSELIPVKKYSRINFKNLSGEFQQSNKNTALTAIETFKKYSMNLHFKEKKGSGVNCNGKKYNIGNNNDEKYNVEISNYGKNNYKKDYELKLNKNKIISGIKKTRWPGRMQFISKNVLIDCAHNVPGFNTLKKELLIIRKNRKIRKIIFVIGIQKTKDIRKMLESISPLADEIIFTKSSHNAAAEPLIMLKTFSKIIKTHKIGKKIIKNPKRALSYAKKISGKDDLVVAAGSIYLVGNLI